MKKILSVFLILIMVFSTIPLSAFADNLDKAGGIASWDESISEEMHDSYNPYADSSVEITSPSALHITANQSTLVTSESPNPVVLSANEQKDRYTVLVLHNSRGWNIDNNGTIFTVYESPTDELKKAADSFCTALAGDTTVANNYVALIVYGTGASVTPFTSSLDEIKDAISKIEKPESSDGTETGSHTADEHSDDYGLTGAFIEASKMFSNSSSNSNYENSTKNVVVFNTGVDLGGVPTGDGIFTASDSGVWFESGCGVQLYEFANSTNKCFQDLTQVSDNIYSIGILPDRKAFTDKAVEKFGPWIGFFQSTAVIYGQLYDFYKKVILTFDNSKEGARIVQSADELEFVFGDVGDKIVGNEFIYAAGLGGGNYESTFYYNDNYFSKTSYEYNHQLATMSLCMTMAAYGRADVDYSNQQPNLGDMNRADYNIWHLMDQIGFDDIETDLVGTASPIIVNEGAVNRGYPDKPDKDSIGVALGHKESSDGTFNIVAVAIRGGGYEQEWGGNFRIGSNGDHEGFSIARDAVIKALNAYIEKHGKQIKSKPVKLWFTGYSRGSAVANLSAAYVNKNISNYPWVETRDNVFAYCFATPAGTTDKDWNNAIYNNIFCWVSPNDIVPKVAMVQWGFHRYGITKFIPILTTEKTKEDYQSKLTAMLDMFSKLQFEKSDYVVDAFESVNATDYLYRHSDGRIYVWRDTNISNFDYVIEFGEEGQMIAVKYKATTEPMNKKLDYFVKEIATNAFDSRAKYVSDYQKDMIDTIANVLGGGGKIEYSDIMTSFGSILWWAGIWERDSIATIAVNIESVTQAHFPELYLAWMQSLDSNYYLMPTSTGKSREIHINCPVDVAIYNSAGTLVGEIVNNIPTDLGSNSVYVTVDKDGQKVAYLAIDEEYSVELEASDDGQMTYSVSEYDLNETNYTRSVNYYDIEIKKGDVFTGKIENLVITSDVKYPLFNPDGSLLSPSDDLRGDEVASYRIDVQATEGGYVLGQGTRAQGQFAQVEAYAETGYTFDGWFANNKKLSEDAIYRFRIDSDVVLTAQFTSSLATYIITATSGTGGSVTGSGTFAPNAQVKLTATADNGYTFDGWYEDNTKVAGAGSEYTFNATANRTLEARFTQNPTQTTYTITAAAGTGGTVSGGGTLNSGSTVTLIATPNNNYAFDSWFEGGARIDGAGATYSFTATANRTLEARFTYIGGNSDNGNSSNDSSNGISYTSASLNIRDAKFDKSKPKDIAVTLSQGSYSFRDIRNGNYVLVRDTDYTVNGNTYTIKSAYSAKLDNGKSTLVFNMSGGTNPKFVITIEGETPTIEPTPEPKPVFKSDGVLLNGKEVEINLNADGSVTISQDDLQGLATPILLTLPFANGTNSHTGVLKKAGQDIIIPFSVYKDGAMIILVTEAGTYGVINNKKIFTDINGHWAANTIDFITARAIYSGVGINSFDPNGGMTRAMFAQVLANIESANLTAYSTSRFTDVGNGVWYTAAIEWATDNGIVGGYGGGLFGPDDLITREQMAVMLHNYMKYKGIVLKKDEYIPFADDNHVSSWARESVTDMKRYGLISGVGNNAYAPKDTANRASVAQIFKNFIEAYIK